MDEQYFNTIIDKLQVEVDKLNDSWDSKSADLNELINEKQIEFNSLKAELTGLYSGALTVGLAKSFKGKIKEERHSYKLHSISFYIILSILFSSSLVTFMVLFNSSLADFSEESWSTLYKFYPLYISGYIVLIWALAITNKQRTLSKIIVEEYSHKLVLAETFIGISTEIENSSYPEKQNLQENLLESLLNANKRNIGQIIGLNRSDEHPYKYLSQQFNSLLRQLRKSKKDDALGLLLTSILPQKDSKILDEEK